MIACCIDTVTVAVSVTDGDQARGFVEHDLRQRIKRRGQCFGRGALGAAARIAGLAWGEAMRLGRVTVPAGRVARRVGAAHGATAWPSAAAAPSVSSRAASSWA